MAARLVASHFPAIHRNQTFDISISYRHRRFALSLRTFAVKARSDISLPARLRAERQRLKLTKPEMASQLGIPEGTYVKYEAGTRKLSAKLLASLTKAGVDVTQLLSSDPIGGALPHHAEQPRAGYVFLPLYEVRASAGGGALIEQEQVTDLLAFKEDWLRQELNAGPKDVALLFVQGRSMEPDLRAGDVIMIDVRDTTAQREAIYVLRMDGAILVKELQRLPGGVIKVKSKNPEYEPFEKNVAALQAAADFAIIGRVVWACRRF